MTQISSAEVSKLRKVTGAGMMDCKKALEESAGDFEKAIELIRKRGQAVADKRADREASEGVVLARVTEDGKRGVIIALNCETDFVAKNQDFIAFTQSILDLALEKKASSIEELKNIKFDQATVAEKIIEKIGIIGEKIELSRYEFIEAGKVISYIHPGNKLATIVGFSKDINNQAAKDVAMQVAAMNPISLDKEDVPKEVIAQEIEIGKEQARREGKPEDMLEKIALGKLNKYYKECTLLNQEFIKDNKKSILQYLQETDKEVKVIGFRRISLRA